jgi:hypothetical protein
LKSLVVTAEEWLAARLLHAQFKVVKNCPWQQSESALSRGFESDISLASIGLHHQKWRLTKLLIQVWNLLDDAFESAGMATVAPLDELDLAAIAHSLLARQRYLDRLHIHI